MSYLYVRLAGAALVHTGKTRQKKYSRLWLYTRRLATVQIWK